MPEQFLTPEERRKLWEYRSRVMHDGVAKAVFTRSEAEEFNGMAQTLPVVVVGANRIGRQSSQTRSARVAQ